MNKNIFWQPLLLLLLLSQPLLAQTSLPACTAEIADLDLDRPDDNDGAGGIIDIDKDGDGLIEICDLEGINEMRHQLNGSGYKASAGATKITQGCPPTGCRGYELVKDLDFKTDASYRTISNKATWTMGSGWVPIGSLNNRFSSVFEGNGHTISNLYINRSGGVGLFAVTAKDAQINNIKLSDVNVRGRNDTGSLVSLNEGSIISIDVTGTVNGNEDVGGLVANNGGTITRCVANVMVRGISRIGGLVGFHGNGVISESRASGNVTGNENVGGLVGANNSSIANSYAEGTVSGGTRVGGLVGRLDGRITNSYAIGKVSGDQWVGGLIGVRLSGSITNSYGGAGARLQSPTAPGKTSMEIYYGWSTDIWDFGSTNTYPLLRSAGSFTVDGLEVVIDKDADDDGLIEIYSLEGLNEMRHQLNGSGYKASADATTITQGCPESGCIGYELMTDLDFNADASYYTTSNKVTWTTASGWLPIGSDSDRFSGVFEGNGHTISNLYIDRNSNNIGLFAVTAGTVQIQNIRLLNVTIQGAMYVGSLVGSNFGSIINSDVTAATIVGNSQIGGLVGANRGNIISSFAYTDVIGLSNVGGLLGDNTGNITNTYAAGTVSSTQTVSHAGGLVGNNQSSGSIMNSYAVSRVMPLTDGSSRVGGLVGNDSGSITASYWDKTINADLTTSSGAKTTAELLNQLHPGATSADTYHNWRTTAWDFGDSIHYPTLYYATIDSLTVSTCADNSAPPSALPRCGSRIPNQAVRDLAPPSSLPACTAEIADLDRDGTNDNDGAAGIIDIDKDGDGLIEICDLEGLNEMRHQLDGSGYNAGARVIIQGCPVSGCRGYELVKDLDFKADTSYRTTSNKVTWTTSSGWIPIGSDSNRFRSVFEGNGHTISNLYIKRSVDNIGLFAVTANAAEINNLKLSDVDVQGGNGTGSLIGINYGSIISVDVTGTVNGVNQLGGLVGTNWGTITRCVANVMVEGVDNIGGLVGNNGFGVISESRASGNVMGAQQIGGLVGQNGGSIANSYAGGTVTGGILAGGLVGRSSGDRITNSYAIGRVIGDQLVGGLAGFSGRGITNSYWNTDIFATSEGGTGKTTDELQSPTAPGTTPTEIYYGWSEEIWDFGSTNTYPLLRSAGSFAVDGLEVVIDKDSDDDGLIEIYDLDDLNEMRYQLDGSGYRTSADATTITQGCPESGCIGYELMTDLDFNADASYRTTPNKVTWTTASGWLPIGSDSNRFSSVFQGNGHTISNLYIDRNSNNIGLFAVTAEDAQIQNIKLLNVTIRGASYVGSLVGSNFGAIINSDVTTATIVGNSRISGLVGRNRDLIINSYAMGATVEGLMSIGGLVGENSGDIISSFAYTDVIGLNNVGGFLGDNTGNIINTYAAGTVASTQTVSHAGGLVGNNQSLIRNSYTVSRVMPVTDINSVVGGLVGNNSGSITASYWDKTVNADLTTSSDAKTTEELLNPTAPGVTSTDTYYDWRTTAWDFGDNDHYPTLYYATTDSLTVSACADNSAPPSALPRCGSRIPNQAVRNLALALGVSEITISSQPVANADGTINEGSSMLLIANATGGSENYSYAWSQISGKALVLTTTNTDILDVAIPSDFVEQGATTAAIIFQVEVSDDVSTIHRSAIITISRTNDGDPVIEVDVNLSRLRVITTTADADGAGSFSYQWQQLVSGGWMDIPAATTATYWLPHDADDRIQYRVKVTHTDGQGYTTDYPIQGPFRAKLDDDNDGLIDIYTLEDLDEIRNQYLNIPNRCGINGDIACNGFELRRSLDFNDADSYQSGMTDLNWTTSTGWLPIGRDNPIAFGSLFEGNGHTLSGLQIDRSDSNVALFSVLNTTGQINNIGLLDVNVRGSFNVASLVAVNHGSIINSYATGEVFGSNSSIGGLVGSNGYSGSIRSSFVDAEVSGQVAVGGLVGLHIGRITNSYATGTVSLTSESDGEVGGLVGQVGSNDGEIINSYALSRVIPGVNNALDAGGLVGVTTGTVIASYWDSETSEQQSSAGAAISRTTAQLQSPTAPGATAEDTYYRWDANIWDFGNNRNYPALRYTAGGVNACNAESTPSDLPQCGSLLPNQERTGEVTLTVSEVTISSQPDANADGTINVGSTVSLMVNATGGSGTYNFAWSQTLGKALELTTAHTATLNVEIPSDFIAEDATSAMLAFTVMVDDGMSTTSRSKIITITKEPVVMEPLTISGVMLSATMIDEGSTATVAVEVSGGTGDYQYMYKLIVGADEIELPPMVPSAVLEMPIDIVAAADSEGVVELNITVSDSSERVERNEALTIKKVDNGLASIEASRATSRTLTVEVGSDPDGDATDPNYAYQWQISTTTAQWMDIDSATDASYTISDDLAEISGEFRVQVTYTDGQGYVKTLTSDAIRYIPPSKIPPLIVSNIKLSSQPPKNADGTINEGSTATLTFEVSGGSDDRYTYDYTIGEQSLPSSSAPSLMYNVPTDLIKGESTTQTVELHITVNDATAGQTLELTVDLTIKKVNNGLADISISITNRTLTVASIGADPDGDTIAPTYAYQWQISTTTAQWMDIDSATDASYTITDDLAETSGEFRVQVTYTDGQGYRVMQTSNEVSYIPPPPSSGLRVRTKVFLEGPLR